MGTPKWLRPSRTPAPSPPKAIPVLTLATLGRGWVAAEALAIAVYCALSADDFATGVLLAVDHAGDSDSTAALTGHLLGTHRGPAAIPARWLADLEFREEIAMIADDLRAISRGILSATNAWHSYLGW